MKKYILFSGLFLSLMMATQPVLAENASTSTSTDATSTIVISDTQASLLANQVCSSYETCPFSNFNTVFRDNHQFKIQAYALSPINKTVTVYGALSAPPASAMIFLDLQNAFLDGYPVDPSVRESVEGILAQNVNILLSKIPGLRIDRLEILDGQIIIEGTLLGQLQKILTENVFLDSLDYLSTNGKGTGSFLPKAAEDENTCENRSDYPDQKCISTDCNSDPLYEIGGQGNCPNPDPDNPLNLCCKKKLSSTPPGPACDPKSAVYGGTDAKKECEDPKNGCTKCIQTTGGYCCEKGFMPKAKCTTACPGGGICIDNPLNSCTFEDFIESIINIIFIFAVALAPLMIIIAAVYWVTSAGDPRKIETAKNMMIYTAVGLAIALLSKGIVAIIKMALDVKK